MRTSSSLEVESWSCLVVTLFGQSINVDPVVM